MTVTRRTAIAALAAAATSCEKKAAVDVSAVLSDPKWGEIQDQDNQRFDIRKVIKGPYLMVFGFKGCPVCNTNITPTIAAVQKAMLDEGLNVPIVVVTMQPKEDKSVNDAASKDPKDMSYEDRYKKMGVVVYDTKPSSFSTPESQGELSLLEKQKSRKLHILFAKDDETAAMLHDAMGATRITTNDVVTHSPRLTLVGPDGKAGAFVMANISSDEERIAAAEKLVQAAKAFPRMVKQ